MAVTALIDRYCDVWNEPDENRRRTLLAALWAPGATYTDPSVHAPDAGALLAHIAKVRARRPGAKIVRTSAVDMHHGYARFAWRVVEAGGTALPEGLDPVSLGLMPSQNETRRLDAAQLAALAASKQVAVSLEPPGGSPTGLPTGPVLYVGAIASPAATS